MMEVFVASEDEVSEAVCLRLIREFAPALGASPTRFRRGGFGYLKSNIEKFAEISRHRPLLLLTDLDKAQCPAELLSSWLGPQAAIPQLFRVAVKEVEAWLLADHEAMRALLGAKARLPEDPEAIEDPKRYLILQARKASSRVKSDILPASGERAVQGLGYNRRLSSFISSHWSPTRAAVRAPSLDRAMRRLRAVATRASD